MIIDCHHHLWDLSRVRYPWLEARGERRFFGDPTAIQRNYLPTDFRGDWDGIPIGGSVHIQVGAASGLEVVETRWLDAQAQASGLPTAIVAFADCTSNAFADTLSQHLEASDRVRGVRQIISRHPDEDLAEEGAALLRDPAFSDGLKILKGRQLSFDLQLTPPHQQLAAEIFAQIPGLRVALCHAGSPWHRDPASMKKWAAGLRSFASLPNTMCKLSGLGMFDPDWTADTLAPVVETVIDIFGADRVMWGSNFPVDKLYRDYRSVSDTVWHLVREPMRERVFGLNAIRFYRLGELCNAG
ncbi:MAG: amidohydrolase family protein [Pontixanthobacter sp.]